MGLILVLYIGPPPPKVEANNIVGDYLNSLLSSDQV